MPRALVGLGSNLGDRRATLDAAVALLNGTQLGGLPQTAVVARSSWYETDPVGGPGGQDEFLNGCVLLETTLAPEALLDELLRIETALGRVREVPWGPRTLDLDLLLYDDLVQSSSRLTLPHPRLSYRKFVLRGAIEIVPTLRHPLLDRTLADLATHLAATPRYAAFVGLSPGFRTQFAGEAAHVSGAKLVAATPAGIAATVEALIAQESGSDSLTAARAIEFLDARTAAVAESLQEADGAWVLDDAWPAAEAATLAAQLDGAERERLVAALPRCLTPNVAPRLIVCVGPTSAALELRQAAPEWITLPPLVAVDIADREAALMEIAAALQAAD
jgi:2-amino-4-hydroxy-6-hydroxymethyldihydropteridine diphosphokinase